MALLDLSCAFDTVDHVTLLSIFSQRFSVTDKAFIWFQSYQTDRCQVFTTDSTQSAPIALSSGIPQGSGLGPTQFIAYTEDTTSIFPYPCQLISIIITTLIIHHSFTLSLQAQNLPFQQILLTLDFFYLPFILFAFMTMGLDRTSSFYF